MGARRWAEAGRISPLALAFALLLAGCASGDGVPPATPTTIAAPPTTSADVTVQGVVGSVSASARVVTLVPPVAGIANLALTTETVIARADGRTATLADVAPGVTVEATGRPSAPGTIVARRLVLR